MTATRIDAFAPATEMLRALRAREISAVELLDLHLDRIARYNPAINAIVTTCFDDARRAAEAADAARGRGEGGALLGLPLTIKDCIDVGGLPGTAGVTEFAERCPEEDSLLAARVRRAGGVLLGKTNIPPMAGDWQSDNPVFGRTNNPWDRQRTPGGSTGGGAAALAAGLTPLEFGSDIGGSIRVPAAFCGVYGHRPSETAIPRSGHFPGTPLPNAATAMGVQGPLARSAEDLELALDVVAGPDVGEDQAWGLTIPPSRHEGISGFRIAVLPPISWLPVDAEIAAALDRVAIRLGSAGAHVAPVQPDAFGDLREHQSVYLSLLTVMTSLGAPAEARASMAAAARTAVPGEFGEAQGRGFEASAADYIQWFGRREQYRAAYRAFFREWDVLLAPAFPTPAFRHIGLEVPFGQRTHTVNDQPIPYIHGTAFPALATLSGQPATAFPVGLTDAGLPIGIQAIGPYLEDRTPIRLAALLAREIGGFQRPPGYGG